MLRNGNDDVHDIYDVDDDDEDDDDNVAAIGTRQYTKRRRRRSASVHETIVDEKLAPSGRDEERERQRSEIGRDTHVRARPRTTGYTCMRAVVPRERERERTRKSERGRREIATLATTGATLLHTLFCRKSSRTTSTRKKIYAPILCVRTSLPVLLLYTLASPSSSSPRSNDSFSLFFFPFFAPSLRSMYARVSTYVYMRACARYVCKILGVRVHARDGKRMSGTEIEKG